MHLVYSALLPKSDLNPESIEEPAAERALRYRAYLATCEKYRHQIAAVRKYFPGWAPNPPAF